MRKLRKALGTKLHGKVSQIQALRAVALFELGKGLVVLLLGFGVVSLVHRDAWDVAENLLRMLHVSPEHHYAQVFLNLADNVTDAKLWAVAAGALVAGCAPAHRLHASAMSSNNSQPRNTDSNFTFTPG